MTYELENPDAVVVKIDAALKRLYAQAIGQLDEAETEGSASWHKKYTTVAAIVDHVPPMYLAGGFATDVAFYAAKLDESRQSVSRNVRVAKLSTTAELARYGPTRLFLAIAYVEAKTKQPITSRGAVEFDKLKIQFKRDGKVFNKPLRGLPTADLQMAVSQASGEEPKPRKETPVAKAVLAAVKASGVKGASATVTKTKVTLRVSVEGLIELIKALSDLKMPGA